MPTQRPETPTQRQAREDRRTGLRLPLQPLTDADVSACQTTHEFLIRDREGVPVIAVLNGGGAAVLAADRVLACLHACRGIATGALKAGVITDLLRAANEKEDQP